MDQTRQVNCIPCPELRCTVRQRSHLPSCPPPRPQGKLSPLMRIMHPQALNSYDVFYPFGTISQWRWRASEGHHTSRDINMSVYLSH
eukprot:scaffold4013_cov429-Prasinococcus_capsulatus_cf.AAC.10